MQSLHIDFALEVYDFPDGSPVVDPFPAIKFRQMGRIQTHTAVVANQAQQKPTLLLPYANGVHIPPNIFFGQLEILLGSLREIDFESLTPAQVQTGLRAIGEQLNHA